MAVKTQDELTNALEEGLYMNILGTSECSWLDFKQSGYQTEPNKQKLSDSGKSELCKDIAGFANHKGGIILIGVKEVLSPNLGTSVADELTPLDVSSINLAHYKQVSMVQIYPLVEHVEMKWYPIASGKGLLAIIVPKSKSTLHILRQYYDNEGRKMRGLEIPVRADDQTYWHTAESLSQLINIRAGANVPEAKQPSLRKKIPYEVLRDISQQHAQQRQASEQEAQSIRSQLLEMNDWSEAPVLTLQAVPLSTDERLDGFYDKIKASFARTKPVRDIGFNLNSLGYESDTVDGAFIKTGAREGAVRLDPNGTLTMELVASPSFLGWSMEKRTSNLEGTTINSIVLVEVIFEFTKFVQEILMPAGLQNWEYHLEVRNFKQHSVYLYSGRPGGFLDDLCKASRNEYRKILPKGTDHTYETFKILTEIYALFTLPESSIPFATGSQITKESILAINADGR